MKYIEIADGLSVKIDEIESVGYGDSEMTSKVYTHHNIYNSTFPYSVLLDLLERNVQEGSEIKQQELNILKTIGSFAG